MFFQIRFDWPDKNGSLIEVSRSEAKEDATTYMSDQLGLHRVQNITHGGNAVSLHLYSPPFGSCHVKIESIF
jgi:cysteine dioxygenase